MNFVFFVSGMNSLDIARAQGADMIEADIRWLAGIYRFKQPCSIKYDNNTTALYKYKLLTYP